MRLDMFEKTIGQETEQLMYLSLARDLGYHITDFMDKTTEEMFIKQQLFYFFRPEMYEIFRSSSSFQTMGSSLKELFTLGYKGISYEIETILTQAKEIDEESEVETVCSYIGSNEYLFYCYERMVKYVKFFYGENNVR